VAGEARGDPARSLVLAGSTLPWLAIDLEVSRLDLAAVSSGLPASSLAGRAGSDGERFSIDLSDARRDGMSLRAQGRLLGELLEVEGARVAAGKAGGGATLELSGSAGLKAPHALKLQGSFERLDPSRLPALLAAIGGKAEADAPPWLARLAGRIDGRWSLGGTVPDAGGDGKGASLRAGLELARGTLAGLPVRADLDASLDGFRPGIGSLEALRLRLARLDAAFGRARLEASGTLGASGDRLSFRLRAPALEELDPLLGDVGLAGALSVDGEASGRLSAPGLALDARGDRLALGTVASVRSLTLGMQLPAAAASLEDAPVTLRVDARELMAGASAIRSLRIDGEGSVRRHALRATVDAQRAGLAAVLSGGLAADGRWSGQLGELTVSGAVPARLAAPVPVEFGGDAGGIAVRVGAAALEGGFGTVRIARAAWRDGRVELVADASLSQLGRIAGTFGLTEGVDGALEPLDLLSLTLRADVAGSSLDDVTGTLAAKLEGAPGAAGAGSAELAVRDGALSGPLQLELPTLAVANRLIGPAWAVDGRIRFDGRVTGTLRQPRLVGDIEGSGLRLTQHAMGWRLRDGTLAGRFDGERFRLDSMKLYSGPAQAAGSVELKGEVRVADLEGRFDLLADRFAVLIGPGQRVVVSGRGEASSSAGAFEIKGQLRADEGRIEVAGGDAPTLPDDVVIVGARGSAADAPQPGAVRSSSLRIASDVTLDLGDDLRVHGSGIDARLAGSLNLRGALPEAPRAFGTVRIREGRYRAYGQELQITRGRVLFNGPIDNPQLDIVALRREQAVEAGVAVTGTALSPQVRLTSRPEVPDAEKLSWLVLGVPLDDARSGGQGAALQAAAATLFGSNDGALAGGLANALGLDMLTIRSGSTGAQGLLPSSFGGGGYGSALPPVPGQVGAAGASAQAAGASGNVLALGKRLSSRVLLTYEQGLHGVWNLLRIQYDITRRLSLRAQTGSESAIDLLYRFSFD
jgi:translocation and assembly module TamB